MNIFFLEVHCLYFFVLPSNSLAKRLEYLAVGHCKDKNGNYIWTQGYRADYDLGQCQSWCKATPDCTAISIGSDGYGCNLFLGGPYIRGDGRSNMRCYAMSGIFTVFVFMRFVKFNEKRCNI